MICGSYCEHGGICELDKGHEGLHDSGGYCQWDDEHALTEEQADALMVVRSPFGAAYIALKDAFGVTGEGVM